MRARTTSHPARQSLAAKVYALRRMQRHAATRFVRAPFLIVLFRAAAPRRAHRSAR